MSSFVSLYLFALLWFPTLTLQSNPRSGSKTLEGPVPMASVSTELSALGEAVRREPEVRIEQNAGNADLGGSEVDFFLDLNVPITEEMIQQCEKVSAGYKVPDMASIETEQAFSTDSIAITNMNTIDYGSSFAKDTIDQGTPNWNGEQIESRPRSPSPEKFLPDFYSSDSPRRSLSLELDRDIRYDSRRGEQRYSPRRRSPSPVRRRHDFPDRDYSQQFIQTRRSDYRHHRSEEERYRPDTDHRFDRDLHHSLRDQPRQRTEEKVPDLKRGRSEVRTPDDRLTKVPRRCSTASKVSMSFASSKEEASKLEDEAAGVTYYNPTSSSLFYDDEETIAAEPIRQPTLPKLVQSKALGNGPSPIRRGERFGRVETCSTFKYFCPYFSKTRIVVFNLPSGTQAAELEQIFLPIGSIYDLWFVQPPHDQEIIAFIEFTNQSAAQTAILERQYYLFKNNKLCVDFASKSFNPNIRLLSIRAPSQERRSEFTPEYIDSIFEPANFASRFGEPAVAYYNHKERRGRVLFPTIPLAMAASKKLIDLGFETQDLKEVHFFTRAERR